MSNNVTNQKKNALPCITCGRRNVESGPLSRVPHDLLDQLREVVAHGAPPTRVDRLLPQLLAAFEAYETENDYLSGELDAVDVDRARAVTSAEIANAIRAERDRFRKWLLRMQLRSQQASLPEASQLERVGMLLGARSTSMVLGAAAIDFAAGVGGDA